MWFLVTTRYRLVMMSEGSISGLSAGMEPWSAFCCLYQLGLPSFHRPFELLYVYRGLKKSQAKDHEHELLDYRAEGQLRCPKEKG